MINSPAKPVPALPPNAVAAEASAPAPLATLAPVVGAFHVQQVVDQTITANDFPRLISLVQALAPQSGTARALGDGLHWEHDSGITSLSLTINPEPAGTFIRADLRADGERMVYALGLGLATLLATLGAIASHWPGMSVVGVTVATLLGGGWVARQVLRQMRRRRAASLEDLVAKIAAGLRGDVT